MLKSNLTREKYSPPLLRYKYAIIVLSKVTGQCQYSLTLLGLEFRLKFQDSERIFRALSLSPILNLFSNWDLAIL